MKEPKNKEKTHIPTIGDFLAPIRRYAAPVTLPNPENLNFNEKTGFAYPEHIAKSDNTPVVTFEKGERDAFLSFRRNDTARYPLEATGENFSRIVPIPEWVPRCSGIFIPGDCGTHGHIKAAVCGKEYCEQCGKNDSIAHRRRISRWWPRLHSFTSVGYMVVTIPIELRKFFLDSEQITDDGEIVKYSGKKTLQKFRRYLLRKLKRQTLNGKTTYRLKSYTYRYKRMTAKGEKTYLRTGYRKIYQGYNAGFIRYHYFGDCEGCNGKGCNACLFTGSGREFKPHLNILIPEGRIKPENLERLKTEIVVWFRKEFKLDYLPGKNIHYQYFHKSALKTHKLKYVTRATFKIYNEPIAKTLFRFHTGSSWGERNFNKEKLGHGVLLEQGCCKVCLKETGELAKIRWGEKLTRDQAQKVINTYRHIENGYYLRFNDIDFNQRN